MKEKCYAKAATNARRMRKDEGQVDEDRKIGPLLPGVAAAHTAELPATRLDIGGGRWDCWREVSGRDSPVLRHALVAVATASITSPSSGRPGWTWARGKSSLRSLLSMS